MFDWVMPPKSALSAPTAWASVSEFAKWWHEAGTPVYPPNDAEIFLTDDATAFCLFRAGQFQVELYLIHADPKLDAHQHPGVEVVQITLVNGYGKMSEVVAPGMAHGDGIARLGLKTGLPLLTFEHWLGGKPSTAAAAWKGPTVGPKQEALIRRFYPDSFVESGYADITKPANYRELLAKGLA